MSRLMEACTGTAIVVDVRSLREVASALGAASRRLEETTRAARGRAIDAYDAIAPSDLQDAYGFCWGRWSQTLLNAAETLSGAEGMTGRTADLYDAVDGPARPRAL